MLLRTLVVFAISSFAIPTVVPSPVYAQDCGTNCSSCGLNKWKGINPLQVGARWSLTCNDFAADCNECDETLVRDQSPKAAELATLLRLGSHTEIARFVTGHQERLLLSTRRNLVVIQGTPCNAQALASVVFVNKATAAALASLGVKSLERYLAELSGPN